MFEKTNRNKWSCLGSERVDCYEQGAESKDLTRWKRSWNSCRSSGSGLAVSRVKGTRRWWRILGRKGGFFWVKKKRNLLGAKRFASSFFSELNQMEFPRKNDTEFPSLVGNKWFKKKKVIWNPKELTLRQMIWFTNKKKRVETLSLVWKEFISGSGVGGVGGAHWWHRIVGRNKQWWAVWEPNDSTLLNELNRMIWLVEKSYNFYH